jgi:transposase
MLGLPPSVRIFVATQPVDGRKGIDSLASIIRSVLGHDVFAGHLYVFFSKRCDRVRVIHWDRNGFALWMKRLERGRFRVPLFHDGQLSVSAIEAAELRARTRIMEWKADGNIMETKPGVSCVSHGDRQGASRGDPGEIPGLNSSA